MGGGVSINYCVPVTQKKEGESAIYRNPLTKDKLYDRPEPALATMKDILLNSYKQYGNYPALGKSYMIKELLCTKIINLLSNTSLTKNLLIRPNVLVVGLYTINSIMLPKVKN